MDLNITLAWTVLPGVFLAAAVLIGLAYNRLHKGFEAVEAERRSHAQVIDRANDALFVIELASGRILQANESATLLLGHSRERLLRLSIFDLHPQEHIALSASRIADAWQAGGAIYEDIPMLHAQGHQVPVECSTKVGSHGGSPAIILSARDITERLRLQREVEAQQAMVHARERDHMAGLTYASRIQEAMFPPPEKLKQLFPDAMLIFLPRDVVSGDLYWFAEVEDGVMVAAADCTGHGVPGGFLSMIGTSLLQRIVVELGVRDPARVLDLLRDRVVAAFDHQGGGPTARDGMDIALVHVDIQRRLVRYAGAYNPLYIVRHGMGAPLLEEIKPDRMPIGWQEGEQRAFTTRVAQLSEGDRLYLFSDGFQDQFGGPKGRKMKATGFKELLLATAHLDIKRQQTLLERAFRAWQGVHEQVDDVLVMGLRV